ncbi:hypothetical protein WN51_02539 [Melipona quadrifasciata]|uniref:Uncharacterized protein n=1 Tax=Melipona quadrifasciata TaxID=166423 RepID=A0A0M8ZVJ4_9HYME|nr:hypothetical protein WN51_02539 [Melipona quadrifasciata]
METKVSPKKEKITRLSLGAAKTQEHEALRRSPCSICFLVNKRFSSEIDVISVVSVGVQKTNNCEQRVRSCFCEKRGQGGTRKNSIKIWFVHSQLKAKHPVPGPLFQEPGFRIVYETVDFYISMRNFKTLVLYLVLPSHSQLVFPSIVLYDTTRRGITKFQSKKFSRIEVVASQLTLLVTILIKVCKMAKDIFHEIEITAINKVAQIFTLVLETEKINSPVALINSNKYEEYFEQNYDKNRRSWLVSASELTNENKLVKFEKSYVTTSRMKRFRNKTESKENRINTVQLEIWLIKKENFDRASFLAKYDRYGTYDTDVGLVSQCTIVLYCNRVEIYHSDSNFFECNIFLRNDETMKVFDDKKTSVTAWDSSTTSFELWLAQVASGCAPSVEVLPIFDVETLRSSKAECGTTPLRWE